MLMNDTNMTIPKIIHYCWFGGKTKPKLVRDCIKSWKKYLPDYEIIEWHEKNTDLSHPFVKHAYESQKWAFVSDYIRLKVLYENGGIYLDTDMMLLKSLDDFLENECFFGAEEENIVSCGIIGAVKQNKFIKECIEHYDFIDLEKKTNWHKTVVTIIITKLFRTKYHFYGVFDKRINYDTITIYPINIFYPFPYEKKEDIVNYKQYIKPDSYALHLWVGSWIVYNEFKFLRNGEYWKGFKIIFQKTLCKNLNVKYIRKIISAIKQSLTK
ncbi:polysaccharide biosynthesis protein CpsM [Flavobacterium frigoris PS1]|uniref:Polysaccharide biosynthesis protein CpsM n=2 Tax=Flavobacterium frigoris TaxID=229204 RepID=H7FM86_FLAFP|nr:polysaccharide biosynthesis protein CpsM [Flavobacterium frigoris PS1]